MQLASQSLAKTSLLAAQLWQQLELATDTDEIDQVLQSIWQNQENQELAADAHADLADQIDAEIAAVKARMEHLVTLHQAAIRKLEGWRERLDQTVLYFNERSIINNEVIGKQRRITIKENPPTCEVKVKPEELPEQYRREQTKTTITANKKAITAAWFQGIPVEGTHVYSKRKVVYGMLPGNNLPEYQANKQLIEPATPTKRTEAKSKRKKHRTAK
ncbi:MAG: siphovirus Gp157 family protein [Xenococcaceae cyanobacterium]